jgi:hypothetical protein
VSVNGVPIGQTVHLPDDPADARGVLSLHRAENFEFGSYGYLTELAADAEPPAVFLPPRKTTNSSSASTCPDPATSAA